MFDLVIRNGLVYDGSGEAPFAADIGIRDGSIKSIDSLGYASAARVIDASGLAVMPGCIDVHSHSDLTLPTHNRAESSIRQGITTEVAGSCGWSMAPCKRETIDGVLKHLISALASVQDYEATNWEWRSFGEYLSALEKKGIGVNLVPMVGQSLVRAHVVGTEDRPATPGEIEGMKALVREAMQAGAYGLSTGRSYEPGGFGGTAEIIELARVVAEFGGVYTTHLKSEAEELFDAVNEAIEIGRKAGVSVQVSHHKAIGQSNFGKVKKTLQMMEEARSEGVRITCDVYPYDFAQVSMLWRILPRKFQEMGPQAILQRLPDPGFREEIRAEFHKSPRSKKAMESSENYLIVSCPAKREVEWKTLKDIASARDLVDTVADLLIETALKIKFAARMDETDVQTVIKHPLTMIGTDAFCLDRDMGEDVPVHPRHYGSFPRVLGHYVRDVGLVSLAEMIKKVTSMPARKFGLTDRGMLKPGYWADILVFDPATIVDKAIAENPYALAPGLPYVVVNGKVTLDNGEYNPVFAGKILRRS